MSEWLLFLPPIATNPRTQNQICLLSHTHTPACARASSLCGFSPPRVSAHVDPSHLLCCRDSLTENKLTKNIWSRKKKKEEGRKKVRKTTTCQEQNASNFSVIWQPFNKTRSLCPHTPPQRRREADRLSAERSRASDVSLISTHPTWPPCPGWKVPPFFRLFCTSANARTNIYKQTAQVGTCLR